MVATLRYARPPMYAKQLAAFFNPARYGLIEGSTKSGKTVGGMSWLWEQAMFAPPKSHVVWVAPIYAQAEIAYNRYDNGLPQHVCKRNQSKLFLKLPNKTRVWFKGGDKPDSVYGPDYHAALIDEASRTSQELYNAVRSTLTATRGPLRAVGNVRGRINWHYKLCRKAESMAGDKKGIYHYSKLIAQDAVDAGVLDDEEIEDARENLSDRVFRELYQCEPSDDGGNPFGAMAIRKCIREGLSNKPPRWFGVDLAKSHDWTVVIGLDEDGNVSVFERWQNVPWPETVRRIHALVGEVACLVDSTGLGDPVVDTLQVGHGNFEGYLFSQVSKQKLMEGLAVAIQSAKLGYPDCEIVSELDQFEYIYKPSGVRYTAPEGYFDDCVCALALAQMRRITAIDGLGALEYGESLVAAAKAKEQHAPGKTPWH